MKIQATSSKSSTNSSSESFSIDTSKILQTSNDKNEVFYSMRLIPKAGESINNFYNLYVKKNRYGEISQQIIKYSPSIETIRSGYKKFKGHYEILKNVDKNIGQIKGMSDNIKSNSNPCMILTVEVECDNGYVHYEGDGPGDWCNANGSYHLYMLDCSGGGGSSTGLILNNPGMSLGNIASGYVLIPPGIIRVNFTGIYEVDLFIAQLYNNNQTWADNNIDDFNRLISALAEEGVDQSYKNFITEALTFMSNNNISWELYENWFMGGLNGRDGEYVDPDLIEYEIPVTQEPLPTLTAWLSAFPKVSNTIAMEAVDVYDLVGGSLKLSYINQFSSYQNACSIRGSRGLL